MHLMIDLETLSTRPDAVVTQIGAVLFDLDGTSSASVLPLPLIKLDPQEQIDRGLSVDYSTIHWWMRQSAEAIDELPEPDEQRMPLMSQMFDLSSQIAGHTAGQRLDGVWGNPSTFDVVILENLFRITGVETPWDHRAHRCARTLKIAAPDAERPAPEVAHNAVDDAHAQAVWVQNMWREINAPTP